MDKSIWNESIVAPNFEALNKNITCDVLVIGGGMAGILIAQELKERNVNVIVVEGRTIGQGITKNTTAVITAQHDLLYTELLKKKGLKKTKQYLTAQLYAVKRFIELGKDCDLEIVPSVMYSKEDDKTMKQEAELLKSLNCDVEFITNTELPFSIKGAVKLNGMAQFHPLKFLYSMAKDLTIYENTFITKVKENRAYTKNAIITAKKIVIATHYPFINSKGFYFLKMHQNRSYVLGLEAQDKLACTYTSYDQDNLYFRSYNNILLLGGVDRRTGKKQCEFDEVRKYAKLYYPELEEKYSFSAQDCITLDDVPYIGYYSRKKNLFVATGFGEWGMTSSMISAKIISDLITGSKNNFSEVFNPKRSILKPQLLANLGTVLVNFVKPTLKRCPHLGCALKYNKKEKKWECPCHGSRFTQEGELIDNPAMKDAKLQ